MDGLQLGQDSLTCALHASVATVEEWDIPNNNSGDIPRHAYIAVDADIYFMLGTDAAGGAALTVSGKSTATAAATFQAAAGLLRANQPMVIATRGFSHIITCDFDGAFGQTMVITPLEN